MDLFEQLHPELARYWLEQQALDSLQAPRFPENVPIYESWDKAAKRLLSSLKKSPNARLFQDPIDAKQAPNYHAVVTEALDLGTLKQRLSCNYYHRMQEFLDDMQLMFDNCLKYYGNDDSQAMVKASKLLREDFKRLYEQLNIEFYIV